MVLHQPCHYEIISPGERWLNPWRTFHGDSLEPERWERRGNMGRRNCLEWWVGWVWRARKKTNSGRALTVHTPCYLLSSEAWAHFTDEETEAHPAKAAALGFTATVLLGWINFFLIPNFSIFFLKNVFCSDNCSSFRVRHPSEQAPWGGNSCWSQEFLLAHLQGQATHYSSSTPKAARTIGRFFLITKAGREQAKTRKIVPIFPSLVCWGVCTRHFFSSFGFSSIFNIL